MLSRSYIDALTGEIKDVHQALNVHYWFDDLKDDDDKDSADISKNDDWELVIESKRKPNIV